ncbi:PEP-CTERM sorting domain-containing protein [Duganella fentianensis]|nr:PEP-CTERM sorting domain-containing protein [Duganella fentianensis]
MKLLRHALVWVALTVPAAATFATTINFDDLKTDSNGSVIDNGYSGFSWDNYYVIKGEQTSFDPGYGGTVISSPNSAFNGHGGPATFSNAAKFSLASLYLTKVWQDGGTLFEGYRGNQLVFSKTVYSYSGLPVLVSFNGWTDLTSVVMSDDNFSGQSAIDNLSVQVVPEPATYAMLLGGLVLLAAVARRRT